MLSVLNKEMKSRLTIWCRSCNVLLRQSPNGTISTKISSMGLLNATLAYAILTKCGRVAEIYSAPEVLTSGRASMQGDLFSFGILMIEAIRWVDLFRGNVSYAMISLYPDAQISDPRKCAMFNFNCTLNVVGKHHGCERRRAMC